jgi:hypothetical protein
LEVGVEFLTGEQFPLDRFATLQLLGLISLAILNDNLLMSALPQAGLRGKRRPRPSNVILYLSGLPGKAAFPEVRDERKH